MAFPFFLKAKSDLKRTAVADILSGKGKLSEVRTSSGMFIPKGKVQSFLQSSNKFSILLYLYLLFQALSSGFFFFSFFNYRSMKTNKKETEDVARKIQELRVHVELLEMVEFSCCFNLLSLFFPWQKSGLCRTLGGSIPIRAE